MDKSSFIEISREEIYRGTIQELIDQNNEYKGELVIVIEGNTEEVKFENLTIKEHVDFYINDGYSVMDAIKLTTKDRGLKKSEVYDQYHSLEKK